MLPKYMHRPAMFLALAMLCFAPLAQAGTRAKMKVPTRQQGIVQTLWRGLTQIFEKEGASIDPSGNSGSGTGTGVSGTDDEGASIDPWGVSHG